MDDPFSVPGEPLVVEAGDGYLVARKPAGMHCAGSGPTLCAWMADRYPGQAGVRGRAPGEGGLLHRLDGETCGLVLFAADQEAFVALSAAAAGGGFVKAYLAHAVVRDGMPDAGMAGSRPASIAPNGIERERWRLALVRTDAPAIADMLVGSTVSSRFRPYGPGARRVACLAVDGGRSEGRAARKRSTADAYSTEIPGAMPYGTGIVALARLSRGFRHQVRAHFAWLGLPLAGDGTYGTTGGRLGLRAIGLSFPHPRTGATVVVDELPGLDLDLPSWRR